MARALGSYPSCPRFESRCRYHIPKGGGPAALGEPTRRSTPQRNGALVKRLRHRPFTAVIRVRFPYASPSLLGIPAIWRHSSAGRALASHARGHRFEFCCLHHARSDLFSQVASCFLALLRLISPLSGQTSSGGDPNGTNLQRYVCAL